MQTTGRISQDVAAAQGIILFEEGNSDRFCEELPRPTLFHAVSALTYLLSLHLRHEDPF